MGTKADEIMGKIKEYITHVSYRNRQPSAAELKCEIEKEFGWKAGLMLNEAIEELLKEGREV